GGGSGVSGHYWLVSDLSFDSAVWPLRHLFGKGLVEAAQHGRGIGGIRADPAFVDSVDRKGVEMVPALAATALGHDEAGFFKHRKMLHDGAAIELGKKGAECARGHAL